MYIYFSKAQRYTIGMSPTSVGFVTSGDERAKGESPPKTALVRVFSRDPIRGGLTNRGNLVTLRADDTGALFIRFCSHFLEITYSKLRCLQKAIIRDINHRYREISLKVSIGSSGYSQSVIFQKYLIILYMR